MHEENIESPFACQAGLKTLPTCVALLRTRRAVPPTDLRELLFADAV